MFNLLFQLVVVTCLWLCDSQALTCQDAPLNTYPYCNPNLPISERVQDLLGRLTSAEKVNLTNSDQGGVPRLGVPTLGHTECNRGTGTSGATPQIPKSDFPTTLFPQAINLAQSFDRQIFYDMARAISDEVRAKHNGGINSGLDPGNDGFGLVCWGPMVNICRDPRWGRCQEGYGEDPLLSGELVKHWINALQWDPNNLDSGYKEAISTCKHFDAHAGPEKGRGGFDVIIDYPDWMITFQHAMKKCAEAKVSAFMCSYNAINGVPNCANRELLIDILRTDWDFDGYIVSDCGATTGIYNSHHYANNYIEANQMAIKNGQDWVGACGGPSKGVIYYLNDGLKNMTVKMSDIDNALYNVLPQWFELGMLDPPQNNPWADLDLNTVYEKHKSLAYKAAVESFILLKNENNNKLKLPLPNGKMANNSIKFAIVGPSANNSIAYMGDYAAQPLPGDIISPLDSFINEYGQNNIIYAPGCYDTECSVTSDFNDVFNAVLQADIVVYIGGISVQQEGEGHDRTYIELPYNQSLLYQKMYETLLINASYNISKVKPIITCLTYGAPTIDHYMFDTSDKLIGMGYGGEEIGNALINLLIGNESFSGKTSVTWYNGTSQLPNFTHYNMNEYPGRTYKYLITKPIYSFGYGLSYTTFTYNNLKLSTNSISPCDSITVSIDLMNSGNDSSYQNNQNEITMVYLRTLNPSQNVFKEPNIKLVNFTKTFGLNINDKVTITLTILAEQMAVVKGLNYDWILESGNYQVFMGGIMTMDHFNTQTNMFDYPTLLNGTFSIVGNDTNLNDCTQ